MVMTNPSEIENQVFRSETRDIRWRVPSFLNNDQTMLMLLQILSETVEDSHIDSVYGSFRSPWNSGRPSIMEFDEDSFREIVNLYNGFGVDVQLAFNRFDPSIEDLSDFDSNRSLEIISELNKDSGADNSVIVASDRLASYIRNSFSDLKISCSVIRPIFTRVSEKSADDVDYYENLLESSLYDEVTPRPEFFFDNEEFDIEDKGKYVVLCNQTCFRNCPTSVTHYSMYGKRERGEDYDMSFINNCVLRKSEFRNIGERCLMPLDMIENLSNLGFSKFKLQGRNKSPLAFLDILGSYVFEPIGWYQGVKDSILAATAIDEIK